MRDFFRKFDFYAIELDRFERDVDVLIQGTLSASKQYLDKESGTILAEIKAEMDKTRDNEYHEHLENEYGLGLATNASQERFLRNMALVALASRLTHALRHMSKSAESFKPRTEEDKKRYKKTHLSELRRLWLEYSQRLGIDSAVHEDRIAFVDAMNDVRNQIVHDGAEAETFKFLYEIKRSDFSDLKDRSFADTYPAYVSEDGSEVNVSDQQLQTFIQSSLSLVRWLATELRKRELAHIDTQWPTRQ